jgi:hypothetical protein
MKKIISSLVILLMCFALITPINALASDDNIVTGEYVAYNHIDTGKQVVVTITNTSTVDISTTVSVKYFDANGKEIPTYSKDIVTFEAGRTAIIAFDNPKDYETFNVGVYVSLDYYLKGQGVANYIVPNILNWRNYIYFASVKNESLYTVKSINYSVIYYKGDTIIKVVEKSYEDLKSLYTMTTWEHGNDEYDNIKVNINDAYY